MTTSPALTNAFNLAYEAGDKKPLELAKKLFASNNFEQSDQALELFNQLDRITKRYIEDNKLDNADNTINFASGYYLTKADDNKDMRAFYKNGVALGKKYLADGNLLSAKHSFLKQYENIPFGEDGREDARLNLENMRLSYIENDMEREAVNLANDIAIPSSYYPEEPKDSWGYLKEIREKRLANGDKLVGVANTPMAHRADKNSEEFKEAYAFSHRIVDKHIANKAPEAAVKALDSRHFYNKSGRGRDKNLTPDMCDHLSQICDLYIEQGEKDAALELMQKSAIKVPNPSPLLDTLMETINKIRDEAITPDLKNIDTAFNIILWQMHVNSEGKVMPWGSTQWGHYPLTNTFENALFAMTKVGDMFLDQDDLENARAAAIIVNENKGRKQPHDFALTFLDRFQEHCIDTKQPDMADSLISGKNGLRFAALFNKEGKYNKAGDCMAIQFYGSEKCSDSQIKAGEALHKHMKERLSAKDFSGAEHTYIKMKSCLYNFYNTKTPSTKKEVKSISSDKVGQAERDVAALHIEVHGIENSIKYAEGPEEYSNSYVAFWKNDLGSQMLHHILDIHAENKDAEAINDLIKTASNFRQYTGSSISDDVKIKSRETVAEIYHNGDNPEKTLEYAQRHHYYASNYSEKMWSIITNIRDSHEQDGKIEKSKEIAEWQLERAPKNSQQAIDIKQYFEERRALEPEPEDNNFNTILADFVGNLQVGDVKPKSSSSNDCTM